LSKRKRQPEVKRLQTEHLFALARILKKMNLRIDLRRGILPQQVGADVIMQVLTGLGDVEDEVMELLAGLSDVSLEEMKALPLGDFLLLAGDILERSGAGRFLGQLRVLMLRSLQTPSSPATAGASPTSSPSPPRTDSNS